MLNSDSASAQPQTGAGPQTCCGVGDKHGSKVELTAASRYITCHCIIIICGAESAQFPDVLRNPPIWRIMRDVMNGMIMKKNLCIALPLQTYLCLAVTAKTPI